MSIRYRKILFCIYDVRSTTTYKGGFMPLPVDTILSNFPFLPLREAYWLHDEEDTECSPPSVFDRIPEDIDDDDLCGYSLNDPLDVLEVD